MGILGKQIKENDVVLVKYKSSFFRTAVFVGFIIFKDIGINKTLFGCDFMLSDALDLNNNNGGYTKGFKIKKVLSIEVLHRK